MFISSFANMAPIIQFERYGVKIQNNNREIFLPTLGWNILAECEKQVDTALTQKKEVEWEIDLEDKKIYTSMFKGQCYLHIRRWYENRPTRLGVALLLDDWKILKSHMEESAETKMGIVVLTRLLKTGCGGCPPQDANVSFNEALDAVRPCKFILALAEQAEREDLILRTPYDTLTKVILFHLDEVKEDLYHDV